MIQRNAVPLLCAVGGLAMSINISSALSFNTGILLMLIACLIWMRRLGHQ